MKQSLKPAKSGVVNTMALNNQDTASLATERERRKRVMGGSVTRELKPMRRSLIEPDGQSRHQFSDLSKKQNYHTMTEEAVLEETKMKEPGSSRGRMYMARSLERSGHHTSDTALLRGQNAAGGTTLNNDRRLTFHKLKAKSKR